MDPELNIRGKEKLAIASIYNCIRKRLHRHVKYKRSGLAQKNAEEIPCISRRRLKIGNMTSGELFFRQTKPI